MVPGDVNNVHTRLEWARGQQWLACERIHCLASFVPGDVQGGDADAAVLGDAQDAEVEQGMVEGAEGQGVGDLVGPCWLCQRTWAASIATG